MKYDVIIVGAGPMGIYTAYEFMVKSPEKKVLLIDKGHDIYNRNCPILDKKIKQCPKDVFGKTGCKPACSMTSGFGGCGAFSDGKYDRRTGNAQLRKGVYFKNYSFRGHSFSLRLYRI